MEEIKLPQFIETIGCEDLKPFFEDDPRAWNKANSMANTIAKGRAFKKNIEAVVCAAEQRGFEIILQKVEK